jgi:cell wall-associated NlpC family hydrolase
VSIGLLLAPEAGDLLSTLGTMTKLTEQSTLIYRQAITDQNLARALTDQAKVAEQQRRSLADAAKSALAEAKAAADAALAKVEEQQAAADQMYAQLATLKGTTAAVEADYLEGLTAEKEAQEASPPPTPPTAPNPPPPAPNTSAVQGALAFAYAQIGDMYQFAGSGPDRWDCSGLTKGAYASVGVYIGAHLVSSQYYTMGPGDLIFYANGGSPSGGFYHVAMYVGGGQMIEAPREGVPVRVTAVRYWDILPYAGRPTP